MQQPRSLEFAHFLEHSLNPEQKQAVLKKDGVLVVCAGAGSGKTRVITARITNLIVNEHVHPSSIVALTFTNKAAHEMKERVASFLPPESVTPYVGTFHAYCVRLLKAYQHLLPHKQFSILDTDDQKALLTKIINNKGLQKKVTAKNISYLISSAKNAAQSGVVSLSEFPDQLTREIFMIYEQEKERAHCFDFDDLLLETLLLFKKNTEFRTHYQQAIRHVLVDEYQDTNVVQHELLKVMTCSPNNMFNLDSLCIVGDEDQSIYSWRGANVHNIVNFKNDFPGTTHIAIEQNYRSMQPILDAANTIIRNNNMRNPKNLWSTRPGTDRIRVLQTSSEYHEGDCIAELAREIFRRNKQSSCAVLYRSHAQSRAIEEILIRNSIPYKIIGGIQFYERQEIKDLLAYLRLIANPFDRVSFMRVFNVPSRGLGDKFEELFFDAWHYEPFLSFVDIGKHAIKTGLVTGTKQTKLQEFLDLFTDTSPDDATSTALAAIINKIHYFTYLAHAFEGQESLAKIDNVKELVSAVQALEQQGIVKVRDFLDEVALLQDHAQKPVDEQSNCLYLMSLHAAKGLEFDTVILAGLEEGMFPSSRSYYDSAALEEERRLLYVGITRARDYLVITQARNRYIYGTLTTQQPSQFLRELPETVARFDDVTRFRAQNLQAYFATWLSGATTASHVSVTPAHKNDIAFNWDQDPFTAPSKTKSNAAEQRVKKQTAWKKYQPVRHKTFGMGIIETIEEKTGEKVYVTVKFSQGTKKLDATFIEAA